MSRVRLAKIQQYQRLLSSHFIESDFVMVTAEANEPSSQTNGELLLFSRICEREKKERKEIKTSLSLSSRYFVLL